VTTGGDTKYTEVQQTHYDGCWRDRTHHACALREIERLTRCIEICEDTNDRVGAENERLRADLLTRDGQAQELQGEVARLRELLDETCRWYDHFPIGRHTQAAQEND
jgi:chromosome segregation ATPase